LQPAYCLIARPGNEMSYLAYFLPFKLNIWLFVFITTIVLTMAIFILNALSDWSYDDEDSHDDLKKIEAEGKMSKSLAMWERFWDIIAFMLCNTACRDNYLMSYKRYKYAWRTLMLTVIVVGYFVVEVYNAELTSNLTSKTARLPINRMEDILDTDMKLGLSAGSFFVTIMQFATEGAYKRLWEEKVKDQEYGEIQWRDGDGVLLDAIRKKYVLIGFGEKALSFIGRFPCEVTKLPIEPMFATQLGVYLRKNSTLTRIFETTLSVLKEKGVVDTLEKNAIRAASMKRKKCTNQELKLGFNSTVFLFVWCGFGCSAAIAILILEFLFNIIMKSSSE